MSSGVNSAHRADDVLKRLRPLFDRSPTPLPKFSGLADRSVGQKAINLMCIQDRRDHRVIGSKSSHARNPP